MSSLVLLRHGQSLWNRENRFTGWIDIALSEEGIRQAHRAGRLLKAAGIAADKAYVSWLRRAISTVWLVLEECERQYIDVHKSWRLNERHYGALSGLDKKMVAERYGVEQLGRWRRGIDDAPPPCEPDNPAYLPNLLPYARLSETHSIRGESLRATRARLMPVWEKKIAVDLAAGNSVVVASHGNTLRALLWMIAGLTEEKVRQLEIPTGNPLVCHWQGQSGQSWRYLDETRAEPLWIDGRV